MALRQNRYLQELGTSCRSSVFVFSYFAVLSLVNVYGAIALSPRDYQFHSFYYFWHADSGPIGNLSAIMIVNCLISIYLWLEFRRFRTSPYRDRAAPYLYFVGCGLFLMWLQYFYLRVSLVDPRHTALTYDLRRPVALPF
ncbi:MAG: hypothetical protein AAF657_36690 [Acidobacteriota bacterium]